MEFERGKNKNQEEIKRYKDELRIECMMAGGSIPWQKNYKSKIIFPLSAISKAFLYKFRIPSFCINYYFLFL